MAVVADPLSVWRSPLDAVALSEASKLAARQPRCDSTIDQLPGNVTPGLQDTIPAWHYPSNQTIQVTLSQLQKLIGGGGGTPTITFPTDFSAITVYNYGNFVGSPGQSAATNTAALNAMFAAMTSPAVAGITGGLAWIPQFTFAVTGTPQGNLAPNQMIMQGLGGGGSGEGSGFGGVHFEISDSGGAASTFLYANGPHSTGGTEFLNVGFGWNAPAYSTDTAIYAGFENTRVTMCTFVNVPCAVNMAGLQSLYGGGAVGASIDKCTVRYLQGPNATTCFVMASEQGQITNCVTAQGPIGTGGPQNCTCIAVGGGVPSTEHNIISGNHISDWWTGIDFGDLNHALNGKGSQYTTIEANEFQCWASGIRVACSTLVLNERIYGVKIIGNTIIKSQYSNDGSPIVLIDPSGNPNANLESVDLIGNLLFSNVTDDAHHHGVAQQHQYGLQINGGQCINVIGGKISNVGTHAPPDGTANIAITGNCESVLIEGVNLRPKDANAAGGGPNAATNSMWAFLVTGTVTAFPYPIQVRNCDMSNYGPAGPVNVVPALPTDNLFITGCTGYNDQNSAIVAPGGTNAPTLANVSGAWQAATNGLTGGVNYYGPSLLIFTANAASSTFSLNGIVSTLPASSFHAIYLPSPYDRIGFSLPPTQFSWIGK